MGSNEIYTIGREFGSLGKQVGQDLAKRLGIKFYEKELIKLIEKQRQLRNQDFARKYLSRMTKSLQTAFYIRWSWTPTQVALIPQHRFLICL